MHWSYFVRSCLLALASLAGFASSVAAEVDFANDIQPLLARRCYACHGPDVQEGSIRFDERDSLLAEADSGVAAITSGDATNSELIRRVTSHDESERMPPEGKPLSESEVEKLAEWINSGAEYAQHWSFQPVRSPPLPEVADSQWARQPLDRFVQARRDPTGLQPAVEASPRDLIRRVYFDVIGLPPSPETVEELASNWSESTYEKLVDQLLADPAFGDRWARMWLDVVRFAETNSFERDNPKPNAWKYRDYVIRAFNSDKPYNVFVTEQLAGDELPERTEDALTATGYYRLGIWDDEPADPLQARFDEYDDLVSTTSQAFLALTLNCARCHDHKIDPLTQKDYYSMVAFMRDVTSYASRGDELSNNQLDINQELAAQYDSIEQQESALRSEKHDLEQAAIVKMPAPDQRATEGDQRAKVLREKLRDYVDDETWNKYQSLRNQLADLRKKRESLPPRTRVLGLARVDAEPKTTFVLLRGSPHNEGDAVEPVFPNLLGGGSPNLPSDPNGRATSGRRLALAQWIASNDNWMTARVIVNRIWLNYFGRGIVRSPNNFGLMGDRPTHPELLDHLATELMNKDWSLKSLHRTILLSSTYRMSSEANAKALAQDPRNDLLWRQNLKRLSAEQIRDSVLAVSGQLNEQQFGESMYPTLSEEVLASQSQPGKGWGNSSEADQARRSIYIHVKRSLPVPLLSAFDFPETDISCEARFLTTQPGQALSMLNSDWIQQQARVFLARVQREVGDDPQEQARRALELGLSMPAREQDIADLLKLVDELQTKHSMSPEEARRAMCLVVLNLNQFAYLD